MSEDQYLEKCKCLVYLCISAIAEDKVRVPFVRSDGG